MEDLSDCIMRTGLADIKNKGELFTWNNGQIGLGRIHCKLDRCLVNQDWVDHLRGSEANFLLAGLSDHSPCVLKIDEMPSFGPKPFKFFNFWTKDPMFMDLVR
ncbi:hypothetical protein NE237_017411 [Protea cynaroides]|uniref:Uncharacterized protein n=1 Tax=Protea cynaroides TaxID=273540 RepID=A0A9Q0QMY3_9MAGN|nr:hypothetical protein NE237_017411 [Protea cynaroides]